MLERNRRASRPWVAPAAPLGAAPKRAQKPKASVSSEARGAKLLEQVVRAPRDAAARQVYADWLLEHGDPRGQLISLEAHLASSPDAKLRARADTLRRSAEKAFAQRFKSKAARLVFDGGMVSEVTAGLVWLLEQGDALFAAEPIRELAIHPASAAGLPKLAAIKGLERLEWLELERATLALFEALPLAAMPKAGIGLGGFHGVRVRATVSDFLKVKGIGRVKGLSFDKAPSEEELRGLVKDPRLAQMTRFALVRADAGQAAMMATVLSESEWKLERLHLRHLASAAGATLRKRFPGVTLTDGSESEE